MVIGGIGPNGRQTDAVEIYDPVTGAWQRTGSLSAPRRSLAVSLLSNGRVLATGGDTFVGQARSNSEFYGPKSGVWTVMPNLNVPRANHTATLLNDGRVLISGGLFSGPQFDSCELFYYPGRSRE
jgi:N-acetylneuraminic acid mutarotase